MPSEGVAPSRPAGCLPPFREFVRSRKIADQIADLHRFQYTIGYIPNGAFALDAAANRAFAAGTDAIREVLLESGLHSLHQLQVDCPAKSEGSAPRDKPRFCWRMQDDVYHFQVHVTEEGFFITRTSSSLADFYDWYCRFMPHASRIEATIRRATEAAAERAIHSTKVVVRFEFCFTDFKHANDEPDAEHRRNVEVLQDLIPALPNEHGERTPLSSQNFMRLDLKQSRVETFCVSGQERLRNSWYILEAPSNDRGRYISFVAELQNASIEAPRSIAAHPVERGAFDDDTRDEYRTAIIDFLRDRAFEGVVVDLFKNWQFRSCRSM